MTDPCAYVTVESDSPSSLNSQGGLAVNVASDFIAPCLASEKRSPLRTRSPNAPRKSDSNSPVRLASRSLVLTFARRCRNSASDGPTNRSRVRRQFHQEAHVALGSASVDRFRVAADANARGNSTSSASAFRVSTPNRVRSTLKRTPTARGVEPLTASYGWPRGRFNSAPSFESLSIKRKVCNTGHATPTGRTAGEKSYDRNCDTESSPIALSDKAKACTSAVMHSELTANPLSDREARLLA